ncbi:MAG TPA: lipid-A-disaccharide synthase, partial [Gemmatimonadales bacterium]
MSRPRRLLVVAGEPSGDAHAGRAVLEIRRRASDTVIEAVGGPALLRAGATVRWPAQPLSARGFVESLAVLPRHVVLHRQIARALGAGAYDAVLLVDYPGFNLAVARSARAAGVPVLYYVAPQLWAWGAWRARRLRRDVTRLAAVLPFEEGYFSERGVATTFVGHPLLDVARPDRPTARREIGLPPQAMVLGLFPGSRADEIARHWPVFRDAARLLRQRHPALEVVVGAIPGMSYPDADGCLLEAGGAAAFAAADAALCKSGTTTLEAALSDTPMVVAYRMSRGTYALARRLVRIAHVGLVNIVAGAAVTPELIQDAAE